MKIKIDKLSEKITEIINKLNNVKNNLGIYLDISKNIISNYESKYRNYFLIYNISEVKKNNDIIINEINKIVSENDLDSGINDIIKIHKKMSSELQNIVSKESIDLNKNKNISIINNIKIKKETNSILNQRYNLFNNQNSNKNEKDNKINNNLLKTTNINNPFILKDSKNFNNTNPKQNTKLSFNNIDIKTKMNQTTKNNNIRPNSVNKNKTRNSFSNTKINNTDFSRKNSFDNTRSSFSLNKTKKKKNNSLKKIDDMNYFPIQQLYNTKKGSNEILFINIGQEGIKLGETCWELFCLEHKIFDYYNRYNFYDNELIGNINDIFAETMNLNYVPRTLFIDSEPSITNKIKKSDLGYLFRPEQFITGYEFPSELYSSKYSSSSKKLIEIALERIRYLYDYCDNPQGFFISNSIYDGFSSGFTSLLLEKLSDEFSKKVKFCFSFYPSENNNYNINQFNSLFSIHSSLNNSNIIDYIFQNDIISIILQKKLKIYFPEQKNINRFIAQVISSITSPLRYEENCSMLQYFNWLTPNPKLHFLLSSYSPICHHSVVRYENFNVQSITDGTFHSNSMTANCPANYHKLISSLLIYRGSILYSDEVQEAINYVGNKYNIIFNNDKSFGFHSCIIPEQPMFLQDFPKLNNSVCRITNSPCIKKIFLGIKNKIDKENIDNKYFEEGMEKEEVNEAREDLDNLINNYKAIKFGNLDDSSSEEN